MLKKLLLPAAWLSMAYAEEAVITGTTANFDELISSNPKGILVEFYAPWCGHCKKLTPEYESAAQKLKAEGIAVPLVKVDATVETKPAETHSVSGYPTLKWFVGGVASDYDGPREAEGIVTWIKSMTGPSVVEEAPKGDEAFSVTYHAEKMGAFEDVATANRKKAQWFFVATPGAKKMVIQHKGDPAIEVETDSQEEMEKAFKTNIFPLYGALDGETFGKYMEVGNGMIWTLLEMTADTVAESVEKSRDMMVEVAKTVAADMYSVTHTNTVEFAKVLESMFGITTFPKVVIQTKVGDKKNYIYDGEMTKEGILAFFQKVKTGEVKPNLKSEEPPEEPQTDPVKIITGKTIETLAFHDKRDVLLEVYAPWCGHCKKLEPEYLKVGKKVQKEGFEDILWIAKLDGTLNDSPVDSLSWSGFPTLYYTKAGNKTPEKYEGARDAKGIWKWIKKNHSQADLIKQKIAEKTASKDDKEEKKEEKEEL